jgi:hypothetical protein
VVINIVDPDTGKVNAKKYIKERVAELETKYCEIENKYEEALYESGNNSSEANKLNSKLIKIARKIHLYSVCFTIIRAKENLLNDNNKDICEVSYIYR